MNRRTIAEQIFLTGIESVLPDRLIAKEMAIRDKNLVIRDLKFSLEAIGKIYVIGAGKASARMAAEVENILGRRITGGHIAVKYGHSCKLKYIKVSEAGHPIPDANGYKVTKAILKIVSIANENDLVLCLLSGGGSALMPDFPEGSSPEEMILVNYLLVNSGASIKEINAVRKHLSLVKGGQLARAVSPATLVSLILSDVPGDQLDVIASGPTTSDSTTFQNALSVMEKFNLVKSAPLGVIKYLREGEAGHKPETPKQGDPVFERTYNLLIGNNSLALEASKRKASDLGLNPVILNHQLQGDVNTVAEYIVETSLKYKNSKAEIKPLCLLFGGEVTVKMTGKGVGGRNQHLALLASVMLRNNPGITILSGGTDGNDGPTDAAGAVVDSDTVTQALAKNVDPVKYLKVFDSYHFFKKTDGHIITGPTMTNVMDIIVVIVD